MRHSLASYSSGSLCLGRIMCALNSITFAATAILLMMVLSPPARAVDDRGRFVLERQNRTIVFEPYGPHIIRITLSNTDPGALAPPGYGFVGTPSATGWSRERDSAGYD